MTTETAAPSIPQPPPKTSALAIWSLVLGILSITCLWICGTVPAVICGVMALNRIKQSPGALTGHGLAVAGIITGCVGIIAGAFILAIPAGMVLPALNAAREKAREANCMSNVKQISLACIMYAEQHEGVIPGNIDQIKGQLGGGSLPMTLVCPSAKDSKVPSYEIVGGATKLDGEDAASSVMVRETAANHRGKRCVGYKDGHVASKAD